MELFRKEVANIVSGIVEKLNIDFTSMVDNLQKVNIAMNSANIAMNSISGSSEDTAQAVNNQMNMTTQIQGSLENTSELANNARATTENLKNIVGFNMPVVALTADVISGMEEKYISKGFDDCLAKPIVEEELYHMLRKFLKEVTPEEIQQMVLEQPVEATTKEKVEESSPDDLHNVDLLKDNDIEPKDCIDLIESVIEDIF